MKYGFILAIICLGACSSKSKEKDPKPPKITKEDIKKEIKKLPEKMPIKEILLSENGVGRLGAASAFDLDTIQAAFGGYTVIESEGSMEGETYKIFLVKEKEAVILEISSDEGKKVTEILAKSEKINNQIGARVGATFKSIFPKKENADCILGADDLGDTYLCDIPRIKNVRYRFETNKEGQHTPNGDWILTAIEWRPLPTR